MTEALKGIYNRRHPERTDYYRIIEANFDETKRSILFGEKAREIVKPVSHIHITFTRRSYNQL